MSGLDLERCRAQFPALERKARGRPVVYLDGPAGSQVPARVIAAMTRYLANTNANQGGVFPSSRESDALLARGRAALADLFGAADPAEVVFGHNMTTLAQNVAHSLARTLKPGDEVVVTRLDHDANFTPWVRAAEQAGAAVRQVAFRPDDCTLDVAAYDEAIGERTRFVAMGAASNAVGTLNPVAEVARLARRAGARLFVDAVHHAPHAPMDVEAWEADFVVCSAYKFFGPRGVGALWARPGALDELPAFKLRPATDALPGRWESGAMCHEGIVGTSAAVDYLADQGRGPTAHDRRSLLLLAFEKIAAHERSLAARMLAGLRALSAWRVWGIADPARVVERVPTISVTHRRMAPREAAEKLAERGIFAWHGNHYALPVTEELGLEPGGTLRLGLLHYNTVDEVERVLEELESIG